jgi:hypothetical protein
MGEVENKVIKLILQETKMNTSPNDALAGRVERLERENRLMKRFGVVALSVAVAVFVAGARGADGPKVVEAERFVLRDPNGRERGSLQVNSVGTASLSLHDREDQAGIDLVVPADGRGTYLDVWNKAQGHLMLGVGEDRLSLDILDRNRRGLMAIKVEDVNGDRRTQYFSFLEEGRGSLNLALHRDGSGGLAVTVPFGDRRTELWQSANGKSVLRINDIQIAPP